MSEPRHCPHCAAEIPGNSPAGLCPRCLLLAANDSQSGVVSEPAATLLIPPAPASGFVPPTPEELAPLFPQLEILELLGKGGMGAVYKARQPGLDRLVAVKILAPEISRDPAFVERFQREARALAKLNHPHIVAVYDFGQTLAVGLCYIVMEFVDGANLRQAIRTRTLTSAEALAIVPQICEALQFAHDEGVVHRDIKPENILIDKRGRVKIADFGLAKLLGQDASDHSLTATHQVMGTLRYMAPEQMQGSREVDHRADIYSLGVVFYELLTGELPMGRFAPPSKKVQIDVRLDEVVLRALEQDPEQRYQHASDVKTDVETIRTTVAPLPENAEHRDPLDGFRELARFAVTPNPSYAKRVGVPILILFGLWLAATITAHGVYGQKANYQEGPILLIQGGGMVLFGLVAFVMHVVFVARSRADREQGQGPSLTSESGPTPDARGWLVAGALLTMVLISHVVLFAGAFLDSIRGFDGQLVEIGERWGLGSTTESVQVAVVLLGTLFTGLATTGWVVWLYHHSLAKSIQIDDARERARNLVRGPAFGLILMGLVNLPFLTVCFMVTEGARFSSNEPTRVLDWLALPFYLYWGWMSIGLIGGGIQMLGLESLSEARAVSRMSLFWPNLNLFALAPISLWALAVLGRRDVQDAFPVDEKTGPDQTDPISSTSVGQMAGTPVTQLRFTVSDSQDVARQAIFHFSTLGYRLIEQQSDVCVFQRGAQLAGLWETDIRKIQTILTLRTAPAAEASQWVSCNWSVRTLGSWVTRRDIAKLEAEGRELETLLGGRGQPELSVIEPRFSRVAIVGAIWAALGMVASILWVLWNHFYTAPPTPATDVLVAQVREIVYYTPKWPVFFFAITAPFAAMILGGIAFAHIKRSGGRIIGLPLAFADAIFFPLLVLFVGIAFLAAQTIVVIAHVKLPIAEAPAALTSLVICFFIVRAFWSTIAVERKKEINGTTNLEPQQKLVHDDALTVGDHKIARSKWEAALQTCWLAQSNVARQVLWIALNCLCAFCLFAFFSFKGTSDTDGNHLYQIGFLDPWFVFERRIGPGLRSTSGIFLAWSWLFGVGAYASGWLLFKLKREVSH